MKETANLTNFQSDVDMISADVEVLRAFLRKHRLDGIEMMLCAPWDRKLFPDELIIGNHLPFYPNWMDFWREKTEVVREEFGTDEQIIAQFGGLTREQWLAKYRRQIRDAAATAPEYMVFHVGNVRYRETFSWQFYYDDEDVIDATIEVLKELADCIPSDTWLLLENLWWPGLRLTDRHLTDRILAQSPHPKTGIMLDTGHLLATNTALRTQEEAAQYIHRILTDLGDARDMVKGVHLHQSLSGDYLRRHTGQVPATLTMADIARHIHHIDYHAPWSSPAVHTALQPIAPEWITHEFLQRSLVHWDAQLQVQTDVLRKYEWNA